MGLWSRLLRRRRAAEHETGPAGARAEVSPPQESGKTVELPVEPFVFERQACGKVFEARRKRPQCPECDATEVALISE